METFSKGARGFLVVALQEALERKLGRRLPSGCDGSYGGETVAAVIEFASAQDLVVQDVLRRERAFFGQAGPALFSVLGLEWPELFARCLGLTACFEGTGFEGSCGPKQTGDTAGVTFGVVGFTSYNGELQGLLRDAFDEHRPEFEYVGLSVLGGGPYLRMLELIKDYQDNRAFELWALSSGGSVRPDVKSWLAALGGLPWMRHLEMQAAYERYWSIAYRNTWALFTPENSDKADGVGISARVFALMFDIAVQNGGLKRLELEDLQADFAKPGVALNETDRMHAINTKLIDRLRTAKRPAAIIADVRSRKGCIATGIGRVHEADYVVRGFAL